MGRERMAPTKTTRYSVASVRRIISELEAMVESSTEALDHENDRDYPNDDRIESLETRIESLQSALDALQELQAGE